MDGAVSSSFYLLLLSHAHFLLSYFSRQFEELSEKGEKVGEASKVISEKLAAMQAEVEDTSCTAVEEGQDHEDHSPRESNNNNSK